ncbi:hypothetical protein P280DRAFT_464649 [Massarina eburnea CBS 473.64]|uniref:Uncharacterized protein n=1 Tax=Massarina eburnea CBS 473.64 TaxID=1395130 RepID=A0A6A6SHE8_9PLEO|nr:hypothetical protein P280DRAFT_464649 [Massarina eburnea CBS 473.64]
MKTLPDSEQATNPFDLVWRAALIGTGSAIPGLAIGATYGTLKTSTPVIFSIVSGAQWFAIGTTFWSVRSSILNRDGLQNWWNTRRNAPIIPRHDLIPTSEDRIRASTISGALTGATLGLLFRGPRNVVPGTIMFTLFGWGGQHGYNWLDSRNTVAVEEEQRMREEGVPKENLLQRVTKSKWSPMSLLSDEEYERLIGEKILIVETDIALIDDKIEGLRKQQKEMEAQRQKESQERK